MTSILSIPLPFQYLLKAVLLITAGIIVANVIAETGVFNRISSLSRPICRLSGVSEACAISLLTMVVNATAGKSMLAEFYQKEKVSKKEVIPTLVMGTFPVVLGESLRIHLPTTLILLGPIVGGIYTLMNLFSTFIQMLAAIIYSRLFLFSHCYEDCNNQTPKSGMKQMAVNWKIIKAGCVSAIPTLKRVLPATLVAMVIFYILYAAGIMDALGAVFDPIMNCIGLPGETSAALVAQFLHFSAGYAIVASLMSEGVITLKQALITLVIGSMVIITSIYIKYSMPLYISLFGRFGITVTFITYTSSMTAKLITIMLIVMLF